jgi:hypothetical protein
MSSLVKVPSVTSILLLTRSKVSVSLYVHFTNVFIFNYADSCIQDFFNRFGARCDAWHTKLEFPLLSLIGPVISANITLSKRLSNVRGILCLLDVIELISQTLQVLSLDNLVNMLRAKGLLSKLVDWDAIANLTRMNLLYTRLVLVALSVTLDVLWCSRIVIISLVKIGLDTVLSTFCGSKCDNFTCSADIGNVIKLAR